MLCLACSLVRYIQRNLPSIFPHESSVTTWPSNQTAIGALLNVFETRNKNFFCSSPGWPLLTKHNVGSSSNLQTTLQLPRHLHIIHRNSILSGAQSSSYYFQSSSLHSGCYQTKWWHLNYHLMTIQQKKYKYTLQRCVRSQCAWIMCIGQV